MINIVVTIFFFRKIRTFSLSLIFREFTFQKDIEIPGS